MKLLVHGSGFPRPFQNDPQELRCGKPREVRGNPDCHWSPSSVDWAALGQSSGGSTPAATVDELLKVIEGQRMESIEELRVIGHSNSAFLALGGTITNDSVVFSESAMIGSSNTFEAARPKFQALQNRFTAEALVVLAGCGSGGIGSNLLDLASYTFARTVAGFKTPILYAIDGTTAGPEIRDRATGRSFGRRIDDDARITVRGKAMYSTAANAIEDVLGSDAVGTAALRTNAWELQPDAKSTVGSFFGAVRRFKAAPDAINSAEIVYKIISAFHPLRRHLVAGIGFAGDVNGLSVALDKTIGVGRGFVSRLTPTTVEQRAREVGQALDMIQQRKAGIVPTR